MKIVSSIIAFLLIIQAAFAGENLLINGDFANGSKTGWDIWTDKKFTQPEITISEDGVFHVHRADKTKQPYHSVLKQNVTVEADVYYKLSFEARGDLEEGSFTKAVIAPKRPAHDYDMATQLKITPTTKWETYSTEFKAIELSGEPPVSLKFQLGHAVGDLYIRNIRLERMF